MLDFHFFTHQFTFDSDFSFFLLIYGRVTSKNLGVITPNQWDLQSRSNSSTKGSEGSNNQSYRRWTYRNHGDICEVEPLSSPLGFWGAWWSPQTLVITIPYGTTIGFDPRDAAPSPRVAGSAIFFLASVAVLVLGAAGVTCWLSCQGREGAHTRIKSGFPDSEN
jgi:hypothetical protein